MYVLLRQLRHRGVPLPPSIWKNDRWTEGRLLIFSRDGARGLGLYAIYARPDSEPMGVLYEAKVARVVDDALVLRGIERFVEGHGGVAAVIQEWVLKARTLMEPKDTVRPDLPDRGHEQFMKDIEVAARDYVKPGRSGRLGPGGRR